MQLTVVENCNLTPLDEEKDVYHIRLSYTEPHAYAPGDWLTIQPENPPGLVDVVLELLGLNGEETVDIKRVGPIPSRQALANHCELTLLNPAVLRRHLTTRRLARSPGDDRLC